MPLTVSLTLTGRGGNDYRYSFVICFEFSFSPLLSYLLLPILLLPHHRLGQLLYIIVQNCTSSLKIKSLCPFVSVRCKYPCNLSKIFSVLCISLLKNTT